MRSLQELESDAFLARAESLSQLASHPGWEAFTGLLREMRQAALEELARTPDQGDFRYWQGVAGALAEVLDRPERVVATAAEFQRTEEEEKKVIRPELRAILGAGVDAEETL